MGTNYLADAMDLDGPLANAGGDKEIDEWPDAPTDRNEFYRDLQIVHRSRGTNLDPNPRVHGKPIDLYDLFHNIETRGGYDKVSAEKLLWRKIAAEFQLAATHAAASAFQIKTVYYKNLAAYAIKRVHKQEPPPKEILEDLTAKGSDLLSRTVHNFRPRKLPDNSNNNTPNHNNINGFNAAPLDDDGSEGDQRGTPGDLDGLYSSARGPRQSSSRVFFQPDISSSRHRPPPQIALPLQPSQTAAGYSTTNAALNGSGTSFVSSKFESRTFPLSFRPVPTLFNSPAEYLEKVERDRATQLVKVGRQPEPKPQFMAPGTGYAGPNIYLKVLMALRSKDPEEQRYALTHLVKISHERGDKFRFETFIGFAEGLIEKALDVSSLFYKSSWDISYQRGPELKQTHVLDGIYGTYDILDRIRRLELNEPDDGLETPAFTNAIQLCTEAILILRNMSMLQENARYLAEEQFVIKDVLVILLNLPKRDCTVEIKNDALDIAEQLTVFWALELDDPLYVTLLRYIEQGEDRGWVISALRAICRIALQLDETNKLQDIPCETLNTMMQWCYLEDDELVGACLDFFYQYTAIPDNIQYMLDMQTDNLMDFGAFTEQLARLLLHNSQEVRSVREINPATSLPATKDIAQVPQDLLEQMINIPEPERSALWLRALFEEDKDGEMTQISLWQAYQARFQFFSNNTSKPMLAAAEFIKGISDTFKNTSAQVLQNQAPPKFIIRGIRPRRAPVDFNGRPYMACLWVESGSATNCGQWLLTAENLYEHVLRDHLMVNKTASGKWDVLSAARHAEESKTKLSCHWAACRHFSETNGTYKVAEVVLHVKTHLPDTSDGSENRARHNVSRRRKVDHQAVDDVLEPYVAKAEAAKFQEFTWHNTAARDVPHGRIEPEGLPLSAILILRNIARSIPKAVAGENKDLQVEHWYGKLLWPLRNHLLHVTAVNLSLTANIYDLLEAMEKKTAAPLAQAQY